jgi:hypothetical protein
MAKRNIDLDFVEEKRPNITRGKNYLFVIAIDEYQPPVPRLHNCVSDAKAFVEVLLRRYDYFHTNTTKALYNSEATRSAIRKQLDAYCRTLSSEDSLVIYFAGHGEVDDSITKEGYWIPADSKGEYQDDGFANRDVTARLREDTLKARHVLLFSDSCFSGSFFGKRKLLKDELLALEAVERRSSRWAVTSGGHEPVSDGEQHSPFAKRLLDYLENFDGVGFKAITLGDEVQSLVALNTQGEQTPRNEALGIGHSGGQFVFYLRDAAAATVEPVTPDGIAFQALQKSRNLGDITSFLQNFPESEHFQAALQLLSEVEEELAWNAAKKKDALSAYFGFLGKYPNSRYRTDAQKRIAALQNPTPEPEPEPTPEPEPIQESVTEPTPTAKPNISREWQTMIAEGKVKNALEAVRDYLQARGDNNNLNTVIVLLAQQNRLNKNQMNGLMSFSEAGREQAGITNRLLELISGLKGVK